MATLNCTGVKKHRKHGALARGRRADERLVRQSVRFSSLSNLPTVYLIHKTFCSISLKIIKKKGPATVKRNFNISLSTLMSAVSRSQSRASAATPDLRRK